MSSTKTKVLICPYCGDTQPASERCRMCGGLFEPLSRQASHNAMGPWYVRDENRPFSPGASYETIVKLIERGQINRYTILRSPTTKQFWTVARRVPGIAHLLGYCHNCDATVGKDDHGCPSCGVPFGAYLDRNYLGLPDVKPLPWEAPLVDQGRSRSMTPGFSPLASAAADADYRRAAEPLGLSSFASDEELRGMSSRVSVPASAFESPSTPVDAPSGERINGEVARSTESESNPASEAAAVVSSSGMRSGGAPVAAADVIAARSLQRRVQHQQQTIRLLMIALGAVALLATAVIIALIVRGLPSKTSTGHGAVNASQPNPSEASTSETLAPDASQAEAESASQPLDLEHPAATMPASDLTPPAAVGVEDFKADLDNAAALMTAAKKEDRPLKDRIKDAEAAAALLKKVKAKASPSQQPADLDQQIVEADRLVERLKLLEFFP